MPWRDQDKPARAHRTQLEDLLDRLFELDASPRATRLPEPYRGRTVPAMNVAETEKAYLVTLELPGVDENDITVQLMGNQLVISGERKWEEKQEGKEHHRVESQYGTFSRALTLPQNVPTDPERIEATYRKGLLEITIPKVEPIPTARIQVKRG